MSQAPTIISGGATGADKCWATEALQRGMDVHVCTFEGHRRATLPPGARLILLAPGHRVRFWAELQAVAQRRHLQPRYEPASYVSCLLLRNAMLALRSQALLVIAEQRPSPRAFSRTARPWDCMVYGETGWTVQLFVERHIKHERQPSLAVFAQATSTWYAAHIDFPAQAVRWTAVECPVMAMRLLPAVPTSVGCVGVRQLRDTGRVAIACALEQLQAAREPG